MLEFIFRRYINVCVCVFVWELPSCMTSERTRELRISSGIRSVSGTRLRPATTYPPAFVTCFTCIRVYNPCQRETYERRMYVACVGYVKVWQYRSQHDCQARGIQFLSCCCWLARVYISIYSVRGANLSRERERDLVKTILFNNFALECQFFLFFSIKKWNKISSLLEKLLYTKTLKKYILTMRPCAGSSITRASGRFTDRERERVTDRSSGDSTYVWCGRIKGGKEAFGKFDESGGFERYIYVGDAEYAAHISCL